MNRGLLRHPEFRMYFIATAATMLADNVEHVISYWVIFQRFHSPTLGGFAVISHWVPFLALSIYVGGLADRMDPRRIVQAGMLLFMAVSLAWGVLFASGALQPWHARVLLALHGCAGVLWTPSSQLLLHHIVSEGELARAVRLGATARYLGMLSGPGLGAALLITLGPVHGMWANALLYLPMLLWLWKAPYAGAAGKIERSVRVRGLRDVIETLGAVRRDATIFPMILLAGGAAALIGSAYQAQMPGFAQDLGHGDPSIAYSALLAADAAGALAAGVLLSFARTHPSARAACVLALLWGGALAVFALTHVYALALALLFAAGFCELSFNSMAQALVQLSAPAAIRGRVIGVFTTAAAGLRLFSGFTIGLLGAVIGIHSSLALSAGVLGAWVLMLLRMQWRRRVKC